MADVHVHNDTVPVDTASDSGIAMLVFTLIAILAVAAFAFFAFNGTLFNTATAPGTTNINVETPAPTQPTTNPGATTTPTAPTY